MKKRDSAGAAAETDPRSIAALRASTSVAHAKAERSGILADLLNRRASRQGLALLLRNLLPAYAALERGLALHAGTETVGEIVRHELARQAPLERDLARLAGAGWRDLPLAPSALRYAERIDAAALDDGQLLIAHAYVRYFGDLSGGQIVKRLIQETLGLGPDDVHFYEFDGIDDIADFKQRYRVSFDRAMRAVADPHAVLEEAVAAFEFNITISNEVQALAAPPAFAD